MFGRDPEYRGADFAVRVDPGVRELVTVVHSRAGTTLKLEGERIGKRWQGISLCLPSDIDPGAIPQVVRDLEVAFAALRIGYVISRITGHDPVPEPEQQAAIAEMKGMGWEIERSPDGRRMTQTRIPGVPVADAKASKIQAARMFALMPALRGTRPRFEVLARSKDFAADVEI